MIRPVNEMNYYHDKYNIRNIRQGSGIKYRKHLQQGTGLYGNGLYLGEGQIWDSIKHGTKAVGNFVVNNADNAKKVIDVVHSGVKAGIDIAKDVQELNRTKELRKSQEESLRAKAAKKSVEPTTSAKSNESIFKNLRLQSKAIKEGKGIFLN